MSENWGADQIPRAAGRTNLVEALSSAQHMMAPLNRYIDVRAVWDAEPSLAKFVTAYPA
jgi:hypothetical protein